jgi:flavin-dependent dehydrogenase
MSKPDPASWIASESSDLTLEDGARVAVVGGGPAGSFFSYFLLSMAERLGTDLCVDLYEPRDFLRSGPQGCNKCGGIISESLVQMLATEGIILPPTVVQRGVDSYVLHTDVGDVRIDTPLKEKRIGAVHRGSGPKGVENVKWESFDGYLQRLAVERGATLKTQRVEKLEWTDGRPRLSAKDGSSETYDLLAMATGVNARALEFFEDSGLDYKPAAATKTSIREYFLGEEVVEKHLGSSMHIFLLDIPRLEFAALIPKGDYVTVCLLGDDIDVPLVESFLQSPEVQRCFPPEWNSMDQPQCQCWPQINIEGAHEPFADRLVFVGDCGVARLYKDGIGSAYRTAKAAASTAIFQGVSAESFRKHYVPVLDGISADNAIGKHIFTLTRQIQKRRFTRRALLRTVSREQDSLTSDKRMSTILWDMFTGSAPYKDALSRGINVFFMLRFGWDVLRSIGGGKRQRIS